MIQFDLNIFLGILYLVLVYVAITAVYAIIVTDYFMKIWESKRISGVHRVLLVTAHPDDECMFFGPAIVALSKTFDTRVYVVCLSPGSTKSTFSFIVHHLNLFTSWLIILTVF